MWVGIFTLLLLQVIGMVKCLKKYPKSLFVFYFAVVITIYFSQMMLWSSNTNS